MELFFMGIKTANRILSIPISIEGYTITVGAILLFAIFGTLVVTFIVNLLK